VEHVLVALWRAPRVEPADLHAHIQGPWAEEALSDEQVLSCTVSFAEPDQGRFDRDPCDVLLALGLERAHDLDDIPARDELYRLARNVEVWRVDPRRPIQWERTWPDGEAAPGVKMVSFVRRSPSITHEQFVRHWTETHAPIARRHHAGLWDYTQNVVRRAYTPGGGDVDGIAELHFRSRDDFETKYYDSEDGKRIIREDVKRFIDPGRPGAALMREIPLRTAPELP
jgi:uncharacterized protein (TIGR02118 family)